MNDTTSITQPAGPARKPCEEVHAWAHADGTRGFEMACGDTYDNLQPDEVAAARAGHVCGDEDEPAPGPVEPDRPRWPKLQPGERVTLTIDARVGHTYSDDVEAFALDDDDSPILYLPHNHPNIRVGRGEPADGIPQVGELWADQTGRLHFAVQYRNETAGPTLIDDQASERPWREVHTGPEGPIRRLMTAEQIATYR